MSDSVYEELKKIALEHGIIRVLPPAIVAEGNKRGGVFYALMKPTPPDPYPLPYKLKVLKPR